MSKVLVDREVVARVVDAAFSAYCSQRLGELVPTLRAALKQDPALLQEPVYYRSPTGSGHYKYSRFSCALDNPEPLYAMPQPAQPGVDSSEMVEALNAWASDLERGMQVCIAASSLRKIAAALAAPQPAQQTGGSS